MDKIWFLLYNCIAVPVQYVIFQIARFFHKKVAEGVAGRIGEVDRLRKALAAVPQDRKRILFHCVSVGEWEQARPVIASLKKLNPSICIIVMFFSSSGYNYVKNSGEIDIKVYMPFDSFGRVKKFFKMINPDLWFVVKHDIWPNHAFVAGRMQIPSVIIDATLPPGSLRQSRVLRPFNRAVYRNFSYIFPISDQDKERFLSIYSYPKRMYVCGDTRFDQVYRRAISAKEKEKFYLFDENDRTVFIAGSIWPTDEKHLMPAVIDMLKKYDDLNVILVPHEPVEDHLRDLEKVLNDVSVTSARFTAVQNIRENSARVIIVDTVGILARLYAQTDIAYIGGSFGPGVHNVMEPAILELPVIFGPRHINSLEARHMAENGGGFVVQNSDDIYMILERLLTDRDFRDQSGNKANRLIRENLGATEMIMTQLEMLYDFIPKKNTD